MMLSMTYAAHRTVYRVLAVYVIISRKRNHVVDDGHSVNPSSISLPSRGVCKWGMLLQQKIYTPIDDHNNAEIKQFAQLLTVNPVES